MQPSAVRKADRIAKDRAPAAAFQAAPQSEPGWPQTITAALCFHPVFSGKQAAGAG